MSRFIINKPRDFESSVRQIVKQTFPFASPTPMAMDALEKSFRDGGGEFSTIVPGSKKERFVWGVSRMGCSRIVG